MYSNCLKSQRNNLENNHQIQTRHAYKTNKMPSEQQLNEGINAELDFEICKKTVLVTITTKSR